MGIRKQLETAENLHRQGKLAEAALAYQKVLEVQPDQVDAGYGLGTVYLQQGNTSQALSLLAQTARQVPEDPHVVFNHALALEAAGDPESAVAEALRAGTLARQAPELLLPICRKLLQLDQPAEVVQLLSADGGHYRFPGLEESTKLQWETLTAAAQGDCGDWGSAQSRLQALTQRYPDRADLWRQCSRAATHARNYEIALEAFNTCLSLIEPGARDFLALGDLYLLAHQPEQALAALELAGRKGEKSGAFYLSLAKCHRLLGDYAAVRTALNQAVEKRPSLGGAWLLLLEQASDTEMDSLAQRCVELADRALGTPRDQIQMCFAAGRALEKSKEYARAFQFFVRANRLHRDRLAQQNTPYQPRQTERDMGLIMQLFPSPEFRTATSFHSVASLTSVNGYRGPIFIVGMPRTGSTLVERILGTFEGVANAGENEALEFLAADYYWRLERGEVARPADLSLDQWRTMARRYLSQTPETGDWVTDKMLHNTRHIGLIQGMFPGAPVLYLRRDPRDVCLSIYARMFPDGHRYACDLADLAHFYAQTERIMAHWSALFPGQILEIRYESLIANPEAITREIAHFCGLEWHPDCLEFYRKTDKSFTFSEMQVRKPLNFEGIGRWKCYENQLQDLFLALADQNLISWS